MEELRPQLEVINNSQSSTEELGKAVDILAESVDIGFSTEYRYVAERKTKKRNFNTLPFVLAYSDFVEEVIPSVRKLLKERLPVQFERTEIHRIRHTAILVLYSLPAKIPLARHLERILPLLLEIIVEDNEENAVCCIKKFHELQQHFRHCSHSLFKSFFEFALNAYADALEIASHLFEKKPPKKSSKGSNAAASSHEEFLDSLSSPVAKNFFSNYAVETIFRGDVILPGCCSFRVLREVPLLAKVIYYIYRQYQQTTQRSSKSSDKNAGEDGQTEEESEKTRQYQDFAADLSELLRKISAFLSADVSGREESPRRKEDYLTYSRRFEFLTAQVKALLFAVFLSNRSSNSHSLVKSLRMHLCMQLFRNIPVETNDLWIELLQIFRELIKLRLLKRDENDAAASADVSMDMIMSNFMNEAKRVISSPNMNVYVLVRMYGSIQELVVQLQGITDVSDAVRCLCKGLNDHRLPLTTHLSIYQGLIKSAGNFVQRNKALSSEVRATLSEILVTMIKKVGTLSYMVPSVILAYERAWERLERLRTAEAKVNAHAIAVASMSNQDLPYRDVSSIPKTDSRKIARCRHSSGQSWGAGVFHYSFSHDVESDDDAEEANDEYINETDNFYTDPATTRVSPNRKPSKACLTAEEMDASSAIEAASLLKRLIANLISGICTTSWIISHYGAREKSALQSVPKNGSENKKSSKSEDPPHNPFTDEELRMFRRLLCWGLRCFRLFCTPSKEWPNVSVSSKEISPAMHELTSVDAETASMFHSFAHIFSMLREHALDDVLRGMMPFIFRHMLICPQLILVMTRWLTLENTAKPFTHLLADFLTKHVHLLNPVDSNMAVKPVETVVSSTQSSRSDSLKPHLPECSRGSVIPTLTNHRPLIYMPGFIDLAHPAAPFVSELTSLSLFPAPLRAFIIRWLVDKMFVTISKNPKFKPALKQEIVTLVTGIIRDASSTTDPDGHLVVLTHLFAGFNRATSQAHSLTFDEPEIARLLLRSLMSLHSALEKVEQKEKVIELCLSMPAALRVQLPNLSLLIRPLLLGLSSSGQTATAALNILRSWTERLKPEYLFQFLDQSPDTLKGIFGALCGYLKPSVHKDISKHALAILGSLGGRNRWHLLRPPSLDTVNPDSGKSEVTASIPFKENPSGTTLRLSKLVTLAFVKLNRDIELSHTCTACWCSNDSSRETSSSEPPFSSIFANGCGNTYRQRRAVNAIRKAEQVAWSDSDSNSDDLSHDDDEYAKSSPKDGPDERQKHSKKAVWYFIRNIALRLVDEKQYSDKLKGDMKLACQTQSDHILMDKSIGERPFPSLLPVNDDANLDFSSGRCTLNQYSSSSVLRKIMLSVAMATMDKDLSVSARTLLRDLVQYLALDCVKEGLSLQSSRDGKASDDKIQPASWSSSLLVETIVSLACGRSLNTLMPVVVDMLTLIEETFEEMYSGIENISRREQLMIAGPTGYFFRDLTSHLAHTVTVNAWQPQLGSLCCLLAAMKIFPLEWTRVYQDVVMKSSFHALKKHTMHHAGSVCYAARTNLDCLFRLRYLPGIFYRRRHLQQLPKGTRLLRLKVPADSPTANLFVCLALKPVSEADQSLFVRQELKKFISPDGAQFENEQSDVEQDNLFFNRVKQEQPLVPLGAYVGEDATTIVLTSQHEVRKAFRSLQKIYETVQNQSSSSNIIDRLQISKQPALTIGDVPVYELESPLDAYTPSSSRRSMNTGAREYSGTTSTSRQGKIVPPLLLSDTMKKSFRQAVDIAANELGSFCGPARHASWVFLLRLAKLICRPVEELLKDQGSVDWIHTLMIKLYYRYPFHTLSPKDKIGQLKAIYFLLKKMPLMFPVTLDTATRLKEAVEECKREDVKTRFTKEADKEGSDTRCSIGADADPEELYAVKLASSPIPYQWPDPFSLGWPTFGISAYVSHRCDLQSAKARWYTRGNGNLPPSESPLMRSVDEQSCPPTYIPGISDSVLVDEFTVGTENSSSGKGRSQEAQESLLRPLLFSNAISYSYSRSTASDAVEANKDSGRVPETPARHFVQSKLYEVGNLLRLSQSVSSSIAFDLLACSSFSAATSCPLDSGDFLTKKGYGEYAIGAGICGMPNKTRTYCGQENDRLLPCELEALFTRRENCLYPYPWDSSIATRAFHDSSTHEVMALCSASGAHMNVNFTHATYAEILYITVAELIAIIYSQARDGSHGAGETGLQLVADQKTDAELKEACQHALPSLFHCFMSSNTAVIASVYESLKLVFDFNKKSNSVQQIISSRGVNEILTSLLDNLSAELPNINVKCSVGLSYVMVLHPMMFEIQFREKVLGDLRRLCKPDKKIPGQVSHGLVTSLLSLVHYLPTEDKLVGEILPIYLSLCKDLPSYRISSICSPYLQPVSRILSSQPAKAVEAFLSSQSEHLLTNEGTALLLDLLRHPNARSFKSELGSENGVKLIMEKLLDAPEKVNTSASSSVRSEDELRASKLRYLGMKIIRVITKSSPRILSYQNRNLALKLKNIWLCYCDSGSCTSEIQCSSSSARLCAKILLSFVRMFPVETGMLSSLLYAFRVPTLTDFSFLQTFFLRELPYSTPLPLRRQYIKWFLEFASECADDEMISIALRFWIIPLVRVSLRHESRKRRNLLHSSVKTERSHRSQDSEGEHLFSQDLLNRLVETLYCENENQEGGVIQRSAELHCQLLRLGCLLIYHCKESLSHQKRTLVTYGYHQAKGNEIDVRSWALLFIALFFKEFPDHFDSEAVLNTFVRALRTPFGVDMDTSTNCKPPEYSQLSVTSSKLSQKALSIIIPQLSIQFDHQVLKRAAKYARLILCERYRALHASHVWQVLREHEELIYPFRDDFVPVMHHHLTTLAVPSSSSGHCPSFGVDLVTIFINWEVRERLENMENIEKDSSGSLKAKCGGLANRFRKKTKPCSSSVICNFLIRTALATVQKKDMKGLTRKFTRLLNVALSLWPDVTISTDVFQHMIPENSKEYQKAKEQTEGGSSRAKTNFSDAFQRVLNNKTQRWKEYSQRDFRTLLHNFQPYGIYRYAPVEPGESLLYAVLRCILEILRCPGDARYFVVANTGLLMLLLAPVSRYDSSILWSLFRKILRLLLAQFPLGRPSVQMKHTKFYLWLIRAMSTKLLLSLDFSSRDSEAFANATEDLAAPQFQRGLGETIVRLVSMIRGLDSEDMARQWDPTNVSPNYRLVLDTKYPNPIPPEGVSSLGNGTAEWNKRQIIDEVLAACAQEFISTFMYHATPSSLYELHILRVLQELGHDEYSIFDPLIPPLFKRLKSLVLEQREKTSHHHSKRNDENDKPIYRAQQLKILLDIFSRRIGKCPQAQREELAQLLCTLLQKSQNKSVLQVVMRIVRKWLLFPCGVDPNNNVGLIQSEKSQLLYSLSTFGNSGALKKRQCKHFDWIQKEYFKLLFELYYGRCIQEGENCQREGKSVSGNDSISESSIVLYGQYGRSEAVQPGLFSILQKGSVRGEGPYPMPNKPPRWLAMQLRKQIIPGCCAESVWVRRESFKVLVNSIIGEHMKKDAAFTDCFKTPGKDRICFQSNDSSPLIALKLLVSAPTEIFSAHMWISILLRIALLSTGKYCIGLECDTSLDSRNSHMDNNGIHRAHQIANGTGSGSSTHIAFGLMSNHESGTHDLEEDGADFVSLLAELSTCSFAFSRELWLQMFPCLWHSISSEDKKQLLPFISSMLIGDYHQRYSGLSYGVGDDELQESVNRILHVPEPSTSSQSAYLSSGIKGFRSCGDYHLSLPNTAQSCVSMFYSDHRHQEPPETKSSQWGRLSIEVFFEGISYLGSSLPLRAEVLLYVAKKFRCWSLVIPMLEHQLNMLQHFQQKSNRILSKPASDASSLCYRSIEEKMGMPKGFFASAASNFKENHSNEVDESSSVLPEVNIFDIAPIPGSESDVGMLSQSRLDTLVDLYRSLEYDDLMVGVHRHYSSNKLANLAMTLSSHGDWETSLDAFIELLQQPSPYQKSSRGATEAGVQNNTAAAPAYSRRKRKKPKTLKRVDAPISSLVGQSTKPKRGKRKLSDVSMCPSILEGKGVKRRAPPMFGPVPKSRKINALPGTQTVGENKQVECGIHSCVEYQWWEERWIESARNLCEWPVLNAYSQRVNDPVLMVEAMSRLGEFGDISSLLNTSAVRASLTPAPETKLLEAECLLQNDELRKSYNAVDEASELLKKKWWELPSNVFGGFAHQRLLCMTQLFTEIKEAAVTIDASRRGDNGESLQSCITNWRERLPNVWEGIPVWDQVLTWRYNFFNRIIKIIKDEDSLPTVHDAPWTVIRLAKTGRKLNLPKVCLRSIARCATLKKMEVCDSYMKIREHILVGLQSALSVHGQELSECNIVSSRPSRDQKKKITGVMVRLLSSGLGNFEHPEKSELLRLQGLICAHLGAQTWKEAHDAFSASVKIEPENGLAWLTWGNFLCKLFRFVQPPLDDFSREIQQFSEDPPVSNREKKKDVMNAKVSSHLKHLAESDAAVVDAINAVMLSSGKHVPPNPNRTARTETTSDNADDARLEFTDLGRLMNANVDVADPLEIASQAIIAYLMVAVHSSSKPASQLARVLWLLQYDDEDGRLGNTLRVYGVQVTTWLWLPWIPQLFSGLYSSSVDALFRILASLGQRFPQALYYQLREYCSNKTELKGKDLTWNVTTQEVTLEKDGKQFKARPYTDTRIIKEFTEKRDKMLKESKPIDIEALEHLPKPFRTLVPLSENEKSEPARTRGSSRNDQSAGSNVLVTEEEHCGVSGEDALARSRQHEVSMYSQWCAHRLLSLMHVKHRATVDEMMGLQSILLKLNPSMWGDMFGRIDSIISQCWLLSRAFEKVIPPGIVDNLKRMYENLVGKVQKCDSQQSKEELEQLLKAFGCDFLSEIPEQLTSRGSVYHTNPDFPTNIIELVGRLKKWRRYLQRLCQMEWEQFNSSSRVFNLADRRFSLIEIPGQYYKIEPLPNAISAKVRLHHIEGSVTTVQNRYTHLVERHVTLAGIDGRLYRYAVQTMSHQQTSSDVLSKQMHVFFKDLFASYNDSRARLLGADAPTVIPLDYRHRLMFIDEHSLTFGDVFSQYCSDNEKDDDFVLINFRKRAQLEEQSHIPVYRRTHLHEKSGDTSSTDIPAEDMEAIRRRAMVLAFDRVCKECVPSDILSKYLSQWFHCPDDFYVFKTRFTRQYAVASLMSYVLSLNKKSAHRISFSLSSGSVSIIDFKPSFSWSSLSMKQMDAVPFRMTRNVEQFLTPFGVMGPFANSFTAAAGALHSQSEWMKCYMGLYFRDELVRQRLRGQPMHDTGLRRITDELQGTLQGNVTIFTRRISKLQACEARSTWERYVKHKQNMLDTNNGGSGAASADNSGASLSAMSSISAAPTNEEVRASEQAEQTLRDHEDYILHLIRQARTAQNLCQMPWAWQPWF